VVGFRMRQPTGAHRHGQYCSASNLRRKASWRSRLAERLVERGAYCVAKNSTTPGARDRPSTRVPVERTKQAGGDPRRQARRRPFPRLGFGPDLGC
jgi:hypothetical protein